MANVIDTHCHLADAKFRGDVEAAIQRAHDAGVAQIVTVGAIGTIENDRMTVEIAGHHANVFAAVGVHPHDAKLFDDAAAQKLLDLTKQSRRVIAWGEIGLDYYYDNSPREVQREVFRRQLRLARSVQLPVVIHSREADDDTITILSEELAGKSGTGVPPVKHAQDARATSKLIAHGVLHCFGGSLAMARAAIELGFFISFAGNVTFKKAEALRDVARQLPLERLLIETDCPYLTPVPFRGKRNEPARVIETARCLAELHGQELEEIGRITSENFARLFQV